MTLPYRAARLALVCCLGSVAAGQPTLAQDAMTAPAPPAGPTYADLADLADSASLIVLARVKSLARVEDERAPGLKPGYKRFYIVGETRKLLAGSTPLGQSFAYLADLPVDARGKPAVRKKDAVILFARPVQNRPGELQLVQPRAQVAWNEATESTVRAIAAASFAPDAPARVTGVQEAIYVPGNLAGEGETQIFLRTKDASAASITVRHQPGAAPAWGVSFSELVADVGHPPARDTLEWYRLACFLPRSLPPGSNMSEGPGQQRMAEADYRQVLTSLGPCRRTM